MVHRTLNSEQIDNIIANAPEADRLGQGAG
jgi:hypothetical protein